MSQQINLFNPIFLKQKKYFSAVTMLQALGLILLGAGLMGGYARYQLFALGKEAEATAAQKASIQVRLDKVTAEYAPKQKDEALDKEIARAEQEAKSLLQVFALLDGGDFGNAEGYSQYMKAFSRQIIQGVWLTGFNIRGAGRYISIQGRALQPDLVPAYIGRLKNESVLQGKSFVALEMQASQSGGGKGEAGLQHATMAYVSFDLRSSSGASEKGIPVGSTTKEEKSNTTSAAYLEFSRALAEIRNQPDLAGASSK